MRIALVRTSEVPAHCGAALTAHALSAAGHRVTVLTDDDPTPSALAAAWAGEPPEVVHAIGRAAAVAATGTGLPVVQTVPPGPVSPQPTVADGVARILVASEDQHTALLGHGVPRALLRTVPACVDTDRFTPDGPSLRRGAHPRLVVHGSLHHGEGIATVIAALARVPGAELLVAGGSDGEDPDRDRLFALACELGVAARVRFLGPVEGELLARLLRSADAVLAAPEHDVPAGPVLQAMACGRPVVVSAVGGLRDAVVDGVTGLHVRPGRPADLAATVRELLADDAMRVGYGVAGQDRARSRFDRSRIADTLAGIYADVVDTRAPEAGVVEPAGLVG